jgi:NAD(P)-dependent dehydrogenase (short-subunit alcohol dehydrogenase family)
MAEQNAQKNVVITGGTRGIGFCMASEFLAHGCNVTISGTMEETIKAALGKLSEHKDRIQAALCNVTDYESVASLWDLAVKKWGRVDIWVNNAGINQPFAPVWEVPHSRIAEIMETNITGMMYGSQIAMKGMIGQGEGAIYNMEGWGSDGGHMDNLNVYGTSKCALRYFTMGLSGEAKNHNVIVGRLSPGMMVTDFIIAPLRTDKKRLEGMRKVINLVADKPENVAVFLVTKMIANTKNGAHIAWLTRGKMLGRVLSAPFVKRDLLADFGL